MDGLGGMGLAAKISGLWPKGLGDDDDDEGQDGYPVEGDGPIKTSGGNDYPHPEHEQFFWETEEQADARWEAQNPGWKYSGGYPTRGGGGGEGGGSGGAWGGGRGFGR